MDEFLGHPVEADFVLFRPADVVARLEAAGLRVEGTETRQPDPSVEYPSRRAYVRARRDADPR